MGRGVVSFGSGRIISFAAGTVVSSHSPNEASSGGGLMVATYKIWRLGTASKSEGAGMDTSAVEKGGKSVR